MFTCAYARGSHGGLATASAEDVALSCIVKAELRYGAERSANPAKNHAQLQRFFALLPSLPFDDAAADVYGRMRADLEMRGIPIGPNDLMIAASALSVGLILVTHNVPEFSRVPGLRIEDWQSA